MGIQATRTGEAVACVRGGWKSESLQGEAGGQGLADDGWSQAGCREGLAWWDRTWASKAVQTGRPEAMAGTHKAEQTFPRAQCQLHWELTNTCMLVRWQGEFE